MELSVWHVNGLFMWNKFMEYEMNLKYLFNIFVFGIMWKNPNRSHAI